MQQLQQLFTIFLIVLLMTQTPKSNWLRKKLYETGYFGTYRDVKRLLFAVTIGSVLLFFASIYHAGKSPVATRFGRPADVARVVPKQTPGRVTGDELINGDRVNENQNENGREEQENDDDQQNADQ